MAVKFIPSLGPRGWITDGQTMLDQVMSWIYASDASQSFFFDEVASMTKTIQDHASDIQRARPAVASLLESYFGRFFDDVQVSVDLVENEFKDYHLRGELILRASMLDHTGSEVQLVEVMTNKGSLTRQVLDFDPN